VVGIFAMGMGIENQLGKNEMKDDRKRMCGMNSQIRSKKMGMEKASNKRMAGIVSPLLAKLEWDGGIAGKMSGKYKILAHRTM
jgi:hypothetical protein